MMKYKKSMGMMMIFTAMSLMAAEDRTIIVNTYEDEDGENSSKCSLREAITTASTGKAYGGCKVGQSNPTAMNLIQLKASEKGEKGVYLLKKELQPTSPLTIMGEEPFDYTRPDVLTGQYPALVDVKSTIKAVGKHRIFNTTTLNNPSLNLQNVDLYDGYSEQDGGAIYAGGSVELANVSIYNSQAKNGGAIFLNDPLSSLYAAKGNFKNNQAINGSILGMTCSGNLGYVKRTINLDNLSFIGNGSAQSQSTFNICGEPVMAIRASTITENIAHPNTGSIILFSNRSPNGAVAISSDAQLALQSNTIVNNQAYSTLIYNKYSRVTLGFNLLAFNAQGNANAKSCRYMGDDLDKVEIIAARFSRNALKFDTGTDQCDIPEKNKEDLIKNSVDISKHSITELLVPIANRELTEYTAFMPMYFPNVSMKDNPMIDTGEMGCTNVDQRGIARMSAVNSVGDEQIENTCDVGATEVLRLTAGNIAAGNVSVTAIIEGYKASAKTYKEALENPKLREEFRKYYQEQLKKFEDKAKYTEQNKKFRPAYIDVFVSNLPDEQVQANGERQVKLLNAENYDVTVKSLGVGLLKDKKFQGHYDPNLICEWNKELESVIMYRTDDRITPSGDSEFCQYTLSLKGATPAKTSAAYIMTSFSNIAPVAKDVSYSIALGATQKTPVNLLANTNDDGDGDVKYLKNKPNKKSYYTDTEGRDLAIRFGKIPDAVEVSAERSGSCPGFEPGLTCYGGQIYVKLKNTFDPFDYCVPYMVYDADALVSAEGTLRLKNSGSTSSRCRRGEEGAVIGGGSSGGGSFGGATMIALLGLVAYRQRRSIFKNMAK